MIRWFANREDLVEAVHWLGNNVTAVMKLGGSDIKIHPDKTLTVYSLEGRTHKAEVGDYIVKELGSLKVRTHDDFKREYAEVKI